MEASTNTPVEAFIDTSVKDSTDKSEEDSTDTSAEDPIKTSVKYSVDSTEENERVESSSSKTPFSLGWWNLGKSKSVKKSKIEGRKKTDEVACASEWPVVRDTKYLILRF